MAEAGLGGSIGVEETMTDVLPRSSPVTVLIAPARPFPEKLVKEVAAVGEGDSWTVDEAWALDPSADKIWLLLSVSAGILVSFPVLGIVTDGSEAAEV